MTNGVFEIFQNLVGTVLPRMWSDHASIILKNYHVDYGPIPFELFHSWFKMEGFEHIVLDVRNWHDDLGITNKFIVFKIKLKHVKDRLKEWHKNMVAQNCGNRRSLLNRLDDIYSILDGGNRDEDLILARIDILKLLSDLEKLKGMDVAQKLKINRGIDGNENLNIFIL